MIFWITLGISTLVAIIYLSIGFNEEGVSLFFGLTTIENEIYREGTEAAAQLYSAIFIKFVVGFWLSWVAVILALISCASIFPNMMEEGSAGMLLTKRPSRLLVFISKFVGSLLFMLVQVGLFVFIVFIAMKWRLGEWNFTVFWFLPATVLVFGVLYSFLVLIAVKTRSTLTAILLTMGLWLISWVVGGVEATLFEFSKVEDFSAKAEMRAYEEQLEMVKAMKAENPNAEIELPSLPDRSQEMNTMSKFHGYIKIAYGFLPKTSPIIDAAKNALTVDGNKGYSESGFWAPVMESDGMESAGLSESEIEESLEVSDESQKRHSVAYSVGTTLAFTLVMLLLAGRSFSKKEF